MIFITHVREPGFVLFDTEKVATLYSHDLTVWNFSYRFLKDNSGYSWDPAHAPAICLAVAPPVTAVIAAAPAHFTTRFAHACSFSAVSGSSFGGFGMFVGPQELFRYTPSSWGCGAFVL